MIPEEFLPDLNPMRLVTVCSKCMRASCWAGMFMCDEAQNAGTVERPVAELRQLGLEHPKWWVREVAS